MSEDTQARIADLERQCRFLLGLNFAVLTLLLALLLGGRSNSIAFAQSDDGPRSLMVSQIEVVDESGVVRARLGGDLPDGIIQGKPVPRGAKVAGLMLYDETGQERGGYVTNDSGNVFLTLDTLEKQVALFAAGRSGGAALRLWFEEDSVELRVDENGPSIHAVQAGQAAFHEPPVRDPANSQFCRALKDAASRVSKDELWTACRRRTSEAACQACLGGE